MRSSDRPEIFTPTGMSVASLSVFDADFGICRVLRRSSSSVRTVSAHATWSACVSNERMCVMTAERHRTDTWIACRLASVWRDKDEQPARSPPITTARHDEI